MSHEAVKVRWPICCVGMLDDSRRSCGLSSPGPAGVPRPARDQWPGENLLIGHLLSAVPCASRIHDNHHRRLNSIRSSAMPIHRAVHLSKRPHGHIVPSVTFSISIHESPDIDVLQNGEVILRTLYLSIDPAMRGWLDDDRSYVAPVELGEMMRGQGLAVVEASKSEVFSPGDYVLANTGWSEVVRLHESVLQPVPVSSDVNLTDWMGVLGFTGMTAYFGMTDIGRVRSGDLVVVTGAGGATGSVAGQIAKLKGATVVGIAGSAEKCTQLVSELGFDKALNYKAADFAQEFAHATEALIDVFYDNVGGEILDLALTRAKPHARFVMCGGVSQHNSTEPYGLKNYLKIVRLRIRMEGFIVLDYKDRFEEARTQLAEWLKTKAIKSQETIVRGGLASAERALMGLYEGTNTGKSLLTAPQTTLDAANSQP
ncbi:uncharacterized protein A1O9_10313 [Exophiala aquamarina CBS 119918]|uniref:Enoyl reductase (ER) domain-containing protein n=1 Tax=Exophiala aquamarina CBS 119918 TaxID=1182545 RepID=A0A072P241_9EURO|nr:uncharacterized protein A1O9_10313 [Exophiala aquamarina CBS 119918]KEF53911.1 hypothetical protein A1O9_10313 [Exophiala aquamarina CBS 119918]